MSPSFYDFDHQPRFLGSGGTACVSFISIVPTEPFSVIVSFSSNFLAFLGTRFFGVSILASFKSV